MVFVYLWEVLKSGRPSKPSCECCSVTWARFFLVRHKKMEEKRKSWIWLQFIRRFWFRYQLIRDANQQNFISKSVFVFMHLMMAIVKSVGEAEVSTLLFSFPQLEWFKGACCSGTKGWSCCRGHPRLVRDSMPVVGMKDLLLRRCKRVKVSKDHPRQALNWMSSSLLLDCTYL